MFLATLSDLHAWCLTLGNSRKNRKPPGIFHFFTLTLKIPDKTKLSSWIFHNIVLDPLEVSRPKIKTPVIPHYFFLVTLGNSTSFLINPWKFHMLFLWYHWKFHILNPARLPSPPSVSFFFWNSPLAIHETAAINEITVKIDHVLFTCNWFIVLRKWAHRCILLQKRCFEYVIKFQKILATAIEFISRKESFLKLVNVVWKRTMPQLFFYIATLISSKLWKFSVHGKSFSIHWSGEIFPFHLTFPNKGCSCAAWLHHVRKWSVRFVQLVVKYSLVSNRRDSPLINYSVFCHSLHSSSALPVY